MRTIEDALNRLRTEFLEMPGMHLKPEQLQRLCGVDRGLCQTVLDSLVDARFLRVSADGQYVRATDGDVQSICGEGRPQNRHAWPGVRS